MRPPGNSLDIDQGRRVADTGDTPIDGLIQLLERIRDELDYNDAKGDGSFRLGVHDGLRFAEEAIADLLRRHGHDVHVRQREADA